VPIELLDTYSRGTFLQLLGGWDYSYQTGISSFPKSIGDYRESLNQQCCSPAEVDIKIDYFLHKVCMESGS
jgi:hypothetical protein